MSVIALAMGALGPRAEAQNYPWCANYSKDFGGQNCGFSTREQCMADVSGIGGFCEPNNLYVPRPPPAAAKTVRRHDRATGPEPARPHAAQVA
jgi:hypothetical protein